MVDRVGNAPTASRMSSEHSTFELTVPENFNIKFKKLILQNKTFMYKNLPGDYCESVIPDPIPNSVVKPFSANGTLS